MTRLPVLLACATAAALSACATVGPDFQRPTAPGAAAPSYAMAGDAAPAISAGRAEAIAAGWWRLYRSPELDRLVRQAIAGNHTLEAARANLSRARNALAAQAPELTGNATAGVTEERINFASFGLTEFPGSSGPVENPTVTLYAFGANARYDFDLFGQRRRETEALLADAEAQGFQADAAYMTLSAQVVGRAIDIAALNAQIAALEEVVASDWENLRLARKAFDLGGGTRLDVATVEAELAADEAQIIPLRRDLAAARHALALLVGEAPAGWTAPDFTLADFAAPAPAPLALPAELVRARPDIRAAEARVHAAVARIGVAEGELLPKISLTAAIAQTALTPGKLFGYGATGWSAAPGVSLPIFGRGALKARQRMAEDTARAAVADYQQTALVAFVQVADALDALAHDDQLIARQREAAAASADALRLVRLRQQDGRAGLLPVLDAQRSHARARLALARAQAQRLKDLAQLLYATGQVPAPEQAGAAALTAD